MEDLLFRLGNGAALAGWALLIFVPRWRGLAQGVATFGVPSLLALAYSGLIGAWWGRSEGGFGTLAEVRTLFQTPGLLLAGWLHYLAFDLFVGAWVARESRRDGVPHLLVVPSLVLTFLFGPIGYLASLATRGAWRLGRGDGQGRGRLGRALAGLVGREPTLMVAALLCLASLAPTAAASLVDGRTFDGANPWIKPMKFEVSLGIYLATLAFFFPMAGEGFRRSIGGRYVARAAILTSALELIYIAWRASRAEASHFNFATPTAGALYALMGIAALVLSSAGPVLAWGIARSGAPGWAPAYRLAVVLGLLLSFALGATGGMVMGAGTSHFVGKPPAGATVLPLVGWSRSVGDLRVAHFLGLHAQQVIALAGAAFAYLLGARARVAVVVLSVLYALATIALFLQAMAGRPAWPA